jgi:hypothetical protein
VIAVIARDRRDRKLKIELPPINVRKQSSQE